jgi:hypothetical protein
MTDRRVAISVPVIAEAVAWAEIDGETVAYDEIGKKVHLLSPTATLVWSGIDGHTSFEQIARELSASFGDDPARISSDVEALAQDLEARGLIREAGPAVSAPKASASREGEHGAKTRFLADPPSG